MSPVPKVKAVVFQVDAFTSVPYAGNPAGVCLLDEPADESWMQLVAAEMNLPETAFAYRTQDGYSLRWFSITGEVDICGHATLATAHLLWETGRLPSEVAARFQTLAGELVATRVGDLIEMDFPADRLETAGSGDLSKALGETPHYVGKGRYYSLAAFPTEEVVRSLRPDLLLLSQVVADGVICTAPSATPDADVFSRYFGPSLGNTEDPVTGSSACLLGPYWAPILGRSSFTARQRHGGTGRGGLIEIAARGDRVGIGGRAVTVMRGELYA